MSKNKKISVSGDNYQLDQKYRPQTIDEIILPKSYKRAFKNYIKKGELPHLLLHSTQPGTGKTTTARAIVNDLGLDPSKGEYLFLRGDDVNVSFIKNELQDFCSGASPHEKKRVVIIDEYDRPTLGEAQKLMRATTDAYSDTVTFIITANDPHNIHEALRNRMHSYNFGDINEEDETHMKKEFFKRMMHICELEGIQVEDERVLKYIIGKNFPFFRTCLVELSKYAFANDFKFDVGVLTKILKKERSTLEVINTLKTEPINADKLYAIAKSESYNASNFINSLYIDVKKNIEEISHLNLIKIIGEMNKTFGMAVNKDIHLYYMLIQIASEMKWKTNE